MIAAVPVVPAATHARDAGYDVVLLAHVLAAAVGLGAVVLAGTYAWTLRRSGPGSESIRRYYQPGVNWAGRVLFLVPVLGFALMALSHGDWSFSDGWIMVGLALWAVVAVAAEMALWPAERRLQEAVSSGVSTGPTGITAGGGGSAPLEPAVEPVVELTLEPVAEPSLEPVTEPVAGPSEGLSAAGLRSECLRVAVLSGVLTAVLIATAVLMVAKP
jgi:uncharacterized membrane protein